jgi:hypothetical protein
MFLRRTVKGRGKLGISIVLMVILVAVLSCNAYPNQEMGGIQAVQGTTTVQHGPVVPICRLNIP